MAQERVRRVARRYGAGARAAAVVALVCLLGGLVAAGLLLGGAGGGVTIERAGEAEAEVAPADAAEKDEGPQAETDDAADAGAPEEPEELVVHVDGAVGVPGVYTLPAGSRAADAVEAAGGLAEGADTTSLNLAAPLADGEKIHVPMEGEAASAGASEGAAGAEAPAVVDINEAGVEELDTLPGVGEATARAIVEDREANGPFATPEDLMRVSGIGEKKFAKLEGLIRV